MPAVFRGNHPRREDEYTRTTPRFRNNIFFFLSRDFLARSRRNREKSSSCSCRSFLRHAINLKAVDDVSICRLASIRRSRRWRRTVVYQARYFPRKSSAEPSTRGLIGDSGNFDLDVKTREKGREIYIFISIPQSIMYRFLNAAFKTNNSG